MKQFPDMDHRPGKLTYVSSDRELGEAAIYANAVRGAADRIGATPADIPGLWNAPDYPELTSGQLLDIASRLR